MNIHPATLADRLNEMIAHDTRPPALRDTFSKRTGEKRTNIESVRIVSPQALAGALPTKQIAQTEVANMGHSTWGTFRSGPLTAEAINQGNLADCYLLIAMYLVARLRPHFFDDIFVKVDEKTVVVQWFYSGYVIQVRTSLLISTDYNRAANGDIRPELAEKTWCLIKAGVSDYAANNWGLMHSVFYALGLDASWGKLDSNAIIAAMQAGKAVGLQTTPTVTGSNAVEPWVKSHAYGAIGFDAATRHLTLAQPWQASRAIPGVDMATVSGGKVFNLVHLGTFPKEPRILASMVELEPALPNSGPEPETIAVPADGISFPADKAAVMSNCRLEIQPHKVAIGHINGAAYCEFLLNVAAAGSYTLKIEMAAVAAGEMDVAVNGATHRGGVGVPNTGAWTRFVPVTVTVTLPAGSTTLRISNRNAAQYNIGTLSLAAVAAPQDDPIVAVSVVTTRRSGAVTTTAVA